MSLSRVRHNAAASIRGVGGEPEQQAESRHVAINTSGAAYGVFRYTVTKYL